MARLFELFRATACAHVANSLTCVCVCVCVCARVCVMDLRVSMRRMMSKVQKWKHNFVTKVPHIFLGLYRILYCMYIVMCLGCTVSPRPPTPARCIRTYLNITPCHCPPSPIVGITHVLVSWAWGHFALAKRPPHMGMAALCTGKKAPIYGHGDTLHWRNSPHLWAWKHFALAKKPPYMGMETLCTGKKAPIYGHGDTLHWQKGPHI